MIKWLVEFFVWLIDLRKKRYHENFIDAFLCEAAAVLSILVFLLTGVSKCTQHALHDGSPPKIEQAAPAGSNEQALPLPKSP